MTGTTLAETRKFSIHPDVIYSLIRAQAGSLAKALSECVMNSVDAFAERIDIELSTHGLQVRDNGQGFRDRDEILAWFEVLGFPHDEGNHRLFGKFGMGRAQLWSFASTLWKTNEFELDVDIKKKGLDYELRELVGPYPGLTIEGRFYTPLSGPERIRVEQELEELLCFAPVPVFLNGVRITRDPAKEHWTVETDQAWMSLDTKNRSNSPLRVYNQGVLVGTFGSYRYGVSGVICTKPGHALTLNMARNAILESECKVWAKLRKHFPERAVEKAPPVTRPGEAELKASLARMLADPGDDALAHELQDTQVLTLVTGRWAALPGYGSGTLVSVAPKGDALGKTAMRLKLGLVLTPETLARFGVSSVSALGELLVRYAKARVAALEARPDTGKREAPAYPLYSAMRQLKVFETSRWADSLEEALPELAHRCELVPDKDLGKFELAVLTALRQVGMTLLTRELARIPDALPLVQAPGNFRILAGKSPSKDIWSDGATRVVFEERTLALARQGIAGFTALIQMLAAQALYRTSTVALERHDEARLAFLHQVALSPGVHALALIAMTRFANIAAKHGIKVVRYRLSELDRLLEVDADAEGSPLLSSDMPALEEPGGGEGDEGDDEADSDEMNEPREEDFPESVAPCAAPPETVSEPTAEPPLACVSEPSAAQIAEVFTPEKNVTLAAQTGPSSCQAFAAQVHTPARSRTRSPRGGVAAVPGAPALGQTLSLF